MFAYCGNNPVIFIDPEGTWTLSITLGYDITLFFFGVSVSFGIAIDDDGNIAVQASYSAPNYASDNQTYHTGLADVGVGGSVQFTDDDTVYDLEGPSCYAGFTAGSGGYAGVDMVYSGAEAMNDEHSDRLPNGIAVTGGFGLGIDAHFKQTQTSTLWSINIEELWTWLN